MTISPHDDHSAVPAEVGTGGVPASGGPDSWSTAPPAPLSQYRGPVLAPIGWLTMVLGATGAALASWMIFPQDHPGMFAGYFTLTMVLLVGLAATALRCDAPRLPSLAVSGLAGLALILRGALGDYSTAVQVSMIASGIVIAIGVAMQAAPTDD